MEDRQSIIEQRRIQRKKKRDLKKLHKAEEIQIIEAKRNQCVPLISKEEYEKYANPGAGRPSRPFSANLIEISQKPRNNLILPQPEQKPNKKYSGNPLDSSQPERSTGKHREEPKPKKLTRLKKDVKATQETSDICVKYCENLVNNDVDLLAAKLIAEIVELQEKLYKKDHLKGQRQRKYVVGFNQVMKYLTINKLKALIIAVDVKVLKEDMLHETILKCVRLAKTNNIPYIFALKRRKIGLITMKFLPVSCFGVLNFQGANESFNILIAESKKINPRLDIDEEDNNIASAIRQISGKILTDSQ
ncbi:PREDICTED: selenocysteine insertion sequence-binding protein 2 isoform X2 [Nicrophorus vespilloides]|uniref:Selenocysteine insertion sequence-binding protein 2 isoform X2 n=1 Tax=Nicrophorus vespilloides TaxID=110193 RepID=A0ABM1MCD0_NICVS|nr:PREDICTED: selenocysteine insertion sequence-binding protein 2 isoform X2 [Nicrophorus vespilloides]